jgi:hypothetical protein
MKTSIDTKLAVAGTWIALTAIMFVVDYLGVCVLDMNGLFFNIHIYWFCSSAIVAAIIFGIEVHFIDRRKLSIGSAMAVLAITALWWLLALWIMFMTHGLIGGWY